MTSSPSWRSVAKYEVVIIDAAREEFLSIPLPFRRQVNQRLDKLRPDPRTGAGIAAVSDAFRLDVAGWRILYDVDDDALKITILAFRKVESEG